jgi:hypothetical protein
LKQEVLAKNELSPFNALQDLKVLCRADGFLAEWLPKTSTFYFSLAPIPVTTDTPCIPYISATTLFYLSSGSESRILNGGFSSSSTVNHFEKSN